MKQLFVILIGVLSYFNNDLFIKENTVGGKDLKYNLTNFNDSAFVIWQDSVLSSNDFLAVPDSFSKYSAISSLGIKSFNIVNNKSGYSFDLVAVFNKSKSWIKNNKSQNLLIHEQVHFDIFEVYARKIRKELTKYRNKKLTDTKLYKILNDYYLLCKKETDRYDLETNHGLTKNLQLEWGIKTKGELIKLEKYSDTHIEIKQLVIKYY